MSAAVPARLPPPREAPPPELVPPEPSAAVLEPAEPSAPAPVAFERTGGLPRGVDAKAFVTVEAPVDRSGLLVTSARDQIAARLERSLEHAGYAISGAPTSAGADGGLPSFIVVATVEQVAVAPDGAQTRVDCRIVLRIAPCHGRDGGERWESGRSALATASAHVLAGRLERDVGAAMTDCIDAALDEVTARRVLPFLQRIASAAE